LTISARLEVHVGEAHDFWLLVALLSYACVIIETKIAIAFGG
jgi:hypothetical protein